MTMTTTIAPRIDAGTHADTGRPYYRVYDHDGTHRVTYRSLDRAEAKLARLVRAVETRAIRARVRAGDTPVRHDHEGVRTSQYGPNWEHGAATFADGYRCRYDWDGDGRHPYDYSALPEAE